VTLTLSSRDKDGNERVFAGMHRPPLQHIFEYGLKHGATLWQGPSGETYYTVDAVREAWLRGVFDYPLYRE
jgi:hypothetical protein